MQIYCLGCKRQTDDMGSKKVIMTKKVLTKTSKCASSVADKSRFLKQKSNKKLQGTRLILIFSYAKHRCYKTNCL